MAADAEPDEGKEAPHGKDQHYCKIAIPAHPQKKTAFSGCLSIERGRRLLLEGVDHHAGAEFRFEPRRLRRHDVARVGDVDELLHRDGVEG